MGRFIYETVTGESYPVEDRTLAHLEFAISTKFRRAEPFPFTLRGSELPSGQGIRVFWMHPAIPIVFRYHTDRRSIRLNPLWVEELVAATFSDTGLSILPEPDGNDHSRKLGG